MKKTVVVGQQFGELRVVSRNGSNEEGRAMWLCKCTCGTEDVFTSKQLTTGVFRACRNCQDSGSKSPRHVRLRKYEVAVDGCWNWTGKQNENGYGSITVEGTYTRAHRAMYFMLHPDADQSLVVMHTCDNPRCINPYHLRLGTQKENMMDMHDKGLFKGGAKLGNQNAKGNQGWKKGGIIVIKGYVSSKMGETVEIPEELE